jgi:hypothetical protein
MPSPVHTPPWQEPSPQGVPSGSGGAALHTPVAGSHVPTSLSQSPGSGHVTLKHRSVFGGVHVGLGMSQRWIGTGVGSNEAARLLQECPPRTIHTGNKTAQPCLPPPVHAPAWHEPLLQTVPSVLGGAAPHSPVAWSQAPAALSHSPGAAQVTLKQKSAFGGDECLSGTSQRGCCLSKRPTWKIQATRRRSRVQPHLRRRRPGRCPCCKARHLPWVVPRRTPQWRGRRRQRRSHTPQGLHR